MAVAQLVDWRTRHVKDWLFDAVIGGLATAFLVLATTHIAATGDEHSLDAFAYVLLVAGGLSVAACRHWPKTVLAVVTATLGLYILGRYPGGPIYVVGWIALFWLSWRTDRRTGLVGAALLCGVLSLTSVLVSGSAPLLHLVFLGWSAAAVFLGDALRNRRSYLRELEERARSLELSREEESRRRVAEERLRIARDLHDSVAHGIATINIQAGAAAHVLDRRPESAKPALDAIQDASRDVLDELAAMLRVLRDEDADASRAPTPGMEQIAELVDASTAAHLAVILEVDGPVDTISAPVGTAMYRIVQESLTNVMRHAPGARVRVVIRRDADRVRLAVYDDGDGRSNGVATGNANGLAGSGMGIRGMRERAESTGGALETGPRPSGGYEVVATWPAT
jgi:signal transduction histidine kinase